MDIKTNIKIVNVDEIVNIFKQYPNIFPGGYFRFLKGRLSDKIKKNEIIFERGVILTWTKYKRKTKISPTVSILKGDIKINQLVNKNQGNGMAKKVFQNFLQLHENTTFYLDVKSDNKRAINFYKKNGFKKIGEKTFGKDIQGIIMKRC